MTKFEKTTWIVILTLIIIPLGINFYYEYLKEEVLLIIPAVILLLNIGFIGTLISSIKEIKKSSSRRFYFKIIISVLLMIASIIFCLYLQNNPELNQNIIFFIFPNLSNDTNDIAVETDNAEEEVIETISQSSDDEIINNWFAVDCISEEWSSFNIEYDHEDGCLFFNEVSIESFEGGFGIQHLAENGINFLVFRHIDSSISKITFSVYIEEITTPIISFPNVFYFGFISKDPNSRYPSMTNTPPSVAFDGEFVLFNGFGGVNTNGLIRHGINPSEIYDRVPTDVDFRQKHTYKVDIDIVGNYWNVKIIDLTELRPEFLLSNLSTKGMLLTFGFKIPQDGITNIQIFDLIVE